MKHPFFATCPTGIEPLLNDELLAHGIEETKVQNGGVAFNCKDDKLVQCLLDLKMASRILHKMFEAPIENFEDVYKVSVEFPWDRVFKNTDTLKVKTIVSKEDLRINTDWTNSFLFNQKFKDAYVDKMRTATGSRPSVDKIDPDISFHLFIQNSVLNVYIDLCGMPVSNRGYRDMKFKAPLKENLAAAIVKHMNIDYENENFIEAMCGSGTILIEALYDAVKIPATYAYWNSLNNGNKLWDFQRLDTFKERFILPKLNIDEIKQRVSESKINFQANDWEQKALDHTLDNLEFLGLDKLVTLSRLNASKLVNTHEKNVLFINPPYGERLGEEEAIGKLYYEYFENLKKEFKNSRSYILTGNIKLLKKISLRTSKKHILYNGPIECRLAEYLLY